MANNPLNSPWRLDKEDPHRVLGADGHFIGLIADVKIARIISAASLMYFALDAMLEADSGDKEARALGAIAMAKAKGVERG